MHLRRAALPTKCLHLQCPIGAPRDLPLQNSAGIQLGPPANPVTLYSLEGGSQVLLAQGNSSILSVTPTTTVIYGTGVSNTSIVLGPPNDAGASISLNGGGRLA